MTKKDPTIVVYAVYFGDGSGAYEQSLLYDTWAAALQDLTAALDHERHVLIEPRRMSRAAYDALDDSSAEDGRRARGDESPGTADAVSDQPEGS